MQFEPTKCILCEKSAKRQPQDALNTSYFYECANCGKFFATDDFVRTGTKGNYYLLSGYVNHVNKSSDFPKFEADSLSSFFSHPIMPKNILDKADKLLLHFFKLTEYYTQPVKIAVNPSVCFAKNERELFALYDLLERHEYLTGLMKGGQRTNPEQMLLVTSRGLSRCEDLISIQQTESKSAFVAMWFGENMRSIYEEAIAPAIQECGYVPVRVDNIEHNNDITDEIIAGIRESRFIVADMTGYRGGVYYEAGFAHGLGLPVIFTCRKDWFAGETDDGRVVKERIHFDINHQNIIVWENPDELKTRIANRIKATIL